jgi:hypothetical protein
LRKTGGTTPSCGAASKIKKENKERQRREHEAAAARQAATRAARNSPEAIAKRAGMTPVIRAKLEREWRV